MSDRLVVCLGDLMTDVVVQVRDRVAVGSDTPSTIATSGGGSAANTAAWLGRTGQPVAFVGRVGDDLLGRAALAELEALGVQVRAVRDPLRPTGTCVVMVAEDGQRTMFPDPGANAALAAADLPTDLFVAGHHLHLSGYALLNEGSRGAALAALALARNRGMTISADPASAGPLTRLGPEQMLSWLDGIDLLLPNADEAALLAGLPVPQPGVGAGPDPAEAGRRLAARFPEVVVKQAGGGATWFGPGGAQVVVPARACEVVDSTGAGDSFAAGLLPAWLEGRPPSEALTGGCALAAGVVSRLGARPAV